MSAPVFDDIEYNVAAPNGLIRYRVNQKSIVFRNPSVFMKCLEEDLRVTFNTTKSDKSYVYPPQMIVSNSVGMTKTLSSKIIIMLEHHTLQLADVESKKPYCILVPKEYPQGDLEYHHLVEETIQEHNALYKLMQKLMDAMIPLGPEKDEYKKMRFRTIQDFNIKFNFPLQKGTEKTQVSEFNNLLALTSNNTNPRKRLAIQIMGGWILSPEINTQDTDDLRWNTVGVSFQVYPWACMPMGKPRPARQLRSEKRKAEEEVPRESELPTETVPEGEQKAAAEDVPH